MAYDAGEFEKWHPKPKTRKRKPRKVSAAAIEAAHPVPLDMRRVFKAMAEAIPLLKVTDLQREFIKAAFRTCMEHAALKIIREDAKR